MRILVKLENVNFKVDRRPAILGTHCNSRFTTMCFTFLVGRNKRSAVTAAQTSNLAKMT